MPLCISIYGWWNILQKEKFFYQSLVSSRKGTQKKKQHKIKRMSMMQDKGSRFHIFANLKQIGKKLNQEKVGS